MASVADRSAVAYARFGLGRRAGDEDTHRDDAYIRLLQEIAEGVVAEPGNGALPSSPQILAELHTFYQKPLEERRAPGVKNPARDRLLDELDARYNGTMLEADTGLTERLVMFWANHFAISTDKSAAVAATAGAFEREAIRPFIYGRFFDMLLAVETHPCMIYFLDNQLSAGPDSRQGLKKSVGLNENLAREIMELHTLGVRTGYDQSDVTAFARILTGWTVDHTGKTPNLSPYTFTFNARMHEPGAQSVMGQTYSEDNFMQGAHVLHDLARRPATARHIAFKLARHFISDTPPVSVVNRLQQTFLDTQGDLRAVTLALVQSDEVMAAPDQKLRLPQEYVSAMQRALNTRLEPEKISASLKGMGQPLWSPGGPNGYADTVSVWATPVSLAERVALANRLAHGPDNPPDPRAFAQFQFGPSMSEATRAAIAHAETRPQGLALTFLSPEFMRR